MYKSRFWCAWGWQRGAVVVRGVSWGCWLRSSQAAQAKPAPEAARAWKLL